MATVINDANYNELLASGKPVVIDFWAPWCGPCRSIAPIIEDVAAAYEGKAVIGKYDVDEGDELGVEYGIRNIPTILFFDKEGKMVDKHVGTITRDALAAKLTRCCKFFKTELMRSRSLKQACFYFFAVGESPRDQSMW